MTSRVHVRDKPAPMRAAGPLLAAVLLLGGTELACRFTRFVSREYLPVRVGLTPNLTVAVDAVLRGEPTYLTLSPTLGWTIRPSARSRDGLYRSNAQGFRADREYDPVPPDGRIRIMAFGDSYVHADEVTFDQSWGERLTAADGRFEVVNAGVPASAVDHGLLRYREIRDRVGTDVVLIGFMSENISRLVSVFWPYHVPGWEPPFAKPRFEVRDGRLVLLPSPMTTVADLQRLRDGDPAIFAALGAHDYWYQTRPHEGPEDVLFSVRLVKIALYYARRRLASDHFVDMHKSYVPGSPAWQIAWGVFDAFYREALAQGAVPVIVFFPDVADFTAQPLPRPYALMLERLRGEGRRVLDLADAFPGPPEQYGVTAQWLAEKTHYPPAGNEAVGRWLAVHLAGMGFTERAAIRAAVAQERARLGPDAPAP